ncbi:hypothetical protein [Phenylobacterium sp.]|uniref:hypothetical protein n=1 Tax=Phenylobacterium sp. TaxID=1871053 RepID=UPI001206FB51|nr:hypothetical protein [Phenylobacterium sp.]THD65048.1 MAG: hypothetical protein E8A49_00625 [Phenylobacterium sp.]
MNLPCPTLPIAAALFGMALASPVLADDARDLTGVWTTASWTQLQRSKDAPGLVITEAQGAALHAAGLARAKQGDALGQMTSEFDEGGEGYARIGGQLRSSWIVDPADGRLPYLDAVKKPLQAYGQADGPGAYDHVENRPTGERCLTAEGAGAPILNSPDTNLITLVLTPGTLAIVSEKNHDARIVRLGAPPPGPEEPASWMGTSVGHWEGATLVVETSRLRPGLTHLSDAVPLSDKAHITERFTRNGPDEIAYGFTVDDPGVYARPWRGEMVFRKAKGLMYEFACHEGNYALPGILAGGQKQQAEAAAKGN